MKNKRFFSLAVLIIVCMAAMLLCTACGDASGGSDAGDNQSTGAEAPKIDGLTFSERVELDYAEQFDIFRYEEGYAVIDTHEDTKFLVVPEGKDVPEGLDESIAVVQQPAGNIYLAATSAMSLFDAMGGIDNVTMTSVNADGWTVDAAVKALKSGKMTYAGKYNQPDYELILDKGCDLVIESTMIYHNPEVKEMLEELGMTVFVDRSSYESNPLGRTEWIKAYGVLAGREEEAAAYFEEQKEVISELEGLENTGKTVAFFYVTTDGKVVVRSSHDYVSTMIKMAGGKYAFDGIEDEEGKASVSMTMESFYETAVDADYIIYNGSIDFSVKSLDDLIAKDEIFKRFKAVKEGHCYTTGNSMYQRTDVISSMIMDFHKILTEEDPGEMDFLTKME
ncbi:MAG: ABC transporter substrate-binding protein [Emergencia sp.]